MEAEGGEDPLDTAGKEQGWFLLGLTAWWSTPQTKQFHKPCLQQRKRLAERGAGKADRVRAADTLDRRPRTLGTTGHRSSQSCSHNGPLGSAWVLL